MISASFSSPLSYFTSAIQTLLPCHTAGRLYPPAPISFPRSELNFPQMFLGLAYEILWFSETPRPRSVNQQTQVRCSALVARTDDATARE